MPAQQSFEEAMNQSLPKIPEGVKVDDEDKNKNPNPDKEKEEEEEEEEDDDSAPNFSRKKNEEQDKSKKKEDKKTKEESLAELRKARDEERERNKRYKEVFGDADVSLYKPLIELISEQIEGPVTQEAIVEVLEGIKNKDSVVSDLNQRLQEQDKTITELDIRHSPEFKKKFIEPYQEADRNLLIEFANLDEKGNILGEKSTSSFHRYLTENIDKVDAAAVKAQLAKFARDYEAETGEKPELPTVSALMSSVRDFRSKRNDMQEAFSDWGNKKKKAQEEEAAEEERNRELNIKRNKRERKNLATKAFQDFDHDSIEDIANQLDVSISDLFTEEFKKGEDIFDGKDAPAYDFMIQRGVKAQLFDKFLPELKRLRDFEKEVLEREREGLPPSSRKSTDTKTQTDWDKL
jgi:hypothetical protein